MMGGHGPQAPALALHRTHRHAVARRAAARTALHWRATNRLNTNCRAHKNLIRINLCSNFLRRFLLHWPRKGATLLIEGTPLGSSEMCDYSLHNVKSRPAKVGDKLTTRDFGTGTRGFAASENSTVAVCVLPGTELAFAHEVKRLPARLWAWHDQVIKHTTAIFRQINKEKMAAHHDALEFPDGQIVLLTSLSEGQQATVLQLPAEPKTAHEAEVQRRVAHIG